MDAPTGRHLLSTSQGAIGAFRPTAYTDTVLKRTLFLSIALLGALWVSSCGGGSGPIAPPIDPSRPTNYDLLFPNKICRWDDSAFPIHVNIAPPPVEAGAYGPFMSAAASNAAEVWDGAIDGVNQLFEITTDQSQADITVTWSDIAGGGLTHVVSHPDRIVIDGIFISEDLRDPAAITLILAHELGHALGLGHSKVRNDLMFPALTPGSTKLTPHDKKMLEWLYGREKFLPITGS